MTVIYSFSDMINAHAEFIKKVFKFTGKFGHYAVEISTNNTQKNDRKVHKYVIFINEKSAMDFVKSFDKSHFHKKGGK